MCDLTGQTFGRWAVVGFAHVHTTPSGQQVPYWSCRCACGVERVVRGPSLSSGKSRSCGCLQREVARNQAVDLTGRMFGRLAVVQRDAADGPPVWLCACECGAEVTVGTTLLTMGKTKSCGCWRAGPTSRPHKEVVAYSSAHYRIRRSKGAASRFRCVDCGTQALDWSYSGGDPGELVEAGLAYSLDPNRYVPRCRACHKSHDNAIRREAA